MINVNRFGDKLIGVYHVYLSNEVICSIQYQELERYITELFFQELKEQDQSELFTYNIMSSAKSINQELFGEDFEIIFEFVPNKELIDEIKVVTERLQIGL